ncbi:hypothetical protein [Coralliovum pocilloporae]|uniref:hypothetical protein n=1 Tax=Coralliovum pocilloporae TaxID=3066369 RepID=UPI00330773E7
MDCKQIKIALTASVIATAVMAPNVALAEKPNFRKLACPENSASWRIKDKKADDHKMILRSVSDRFYSYRVCNSTAKNEVNIKFRADFNGADNDLVLMPRSCVDIVDASAIHLAPELDKQEIRGFYCRLSN